MSSNSCSLFPMALNIVIVSLVLVIDVSGNAIGNGASSGCIPCQQPTQGVWLAWAPWSSCSNNGYGVQSQTRTRQCSSNNCVGAADESRQCVQRDPTPPPTWGQWGGWSACSASCGGGVQLRTRVCDTHCGVCQCEGSATEERACNVQECCAWRAWGAWSECSVTCGSGYRTRQRQCTCSQCPSGSAYEQEECNAQVPCPLCNTCYQPPQPITYAPAPVVCNTCQIQYDPPAPAPCTTCNQPIYNPIPAPAPSPCTTCGAQQPYYNPYSNGRKRRTIESPKNATQTL